MQPSEIEALTDEELGRRCKPTGAEEQLLATGCLGALLIVPAGYICLMILGPEVLTRFWFWGPFAFLAGTFALYRRKARHRAPLLEEFERRCGENREEILTEARKALADAEFDWIVVFSYVGLPGGYRVWMKLDVKDGPQPLARADIRRSRRGSERSRKTVNLPESLSRRTAALLDGLDLFALTDVPSMVIDGAPGEVRILRREPPADISASCNLCVFPDDPEADHPTLVLCAGLAQLAEEAWPRVEA
jgi:hypothetical protein